MQVTGQDVRSYIDEQDQLYWETHAVHLEHILCQWSGQDKSARKVKGPLQYRLDKDRLILTLPWTVYRRLQTRWEDHARNLRVRGFRVILPTKLSLWFCFTIDIVLTTT